MNRAQTPTATDRARSEFDVETTQFKDIIDNMRAQFANLVILNQEVAHLDKGTKIVYPDGRQLGRREMNTLNSQFQNSLKKLPRYYTEAKRKRRRTRATNGRDQFRIPAYITGELLDFFKVADFGPAYTLDEQGNCQEQGDLRGYLQLFTDEGIIAGLLLTSLFSIYARHNRMQDPQQRSVYVATEDMRRYLAGTFDALTERDLNEPRSRKANKKDPENTTFVDNEGRSRVAVAPFSPDRILFSDFQRITALSRLKKDQLTAEQAAYLERQDIKDRIAVEVDIVVSTLACLQRFAEAEAPPKQTTRRARAQQDMQQGVMSPGTGRYIPPVPQQTAPVIHPQGRVGMNIQPLNIQNVNGRVSPRVSPRGVSPTQGLQQGFQQGRVSPRALSPTQGLQQGFQQGRVSPVQGQGTLGRPMLGNMANMRQPTARPGFPALNLPSPGQGPIEEQYYDEQ